MDEKLELELIDIVKHSRNLYYEPKQLNYETDIHLIYIKVSDVIVINNKILYYKNQQHYLTDSQLNTFYLFVKLTYKTRKIIPLKN